jgi:hypothetical protein
VPSFEGLTICPANPKSLSLLIIHSAEQQLVMQGVFPSAYSSSGLGISAHRVSPTGSVCLLSLTSERTNRHTHTHYHCKILRPQNPCHMQHNHMHKIAQARGSLSS